LAAANTSSSMSSVVLMHQMLLHQNIQVKCMLPKLCGAVDSSG
jgi:hypothetical protein